MMTRIDLMFFSHNYIKKKFHCGTYCWESYHGENCGNRQYTLNLDSLMFLISNYLRSKVLL